MADDRLNRVFALDVTSQDDSHFKIEEQRSLRNDSTVRKVDVVCLVSAAAANEELKRVLLETFKVELLTSINGSEYKERADVVFLFEDFMSLEFNDLEMSDKRILGPTVVFECASAGKELPLPRKRRPLFCQSMKDVTVCITGSNREEKKYLIALVHFMGGSVREKCTAQITHLVSRTVQTEEYRFSVSFGKPVMHPSWVEECWKKRNVPNSSALNKNFVTDHLLQPFFELRIALYGFSESETRHMREQIGPHGGKDESNTHPRTTHLVVDHLNLNDKPWPEKPNPTCHVVTGEWFWVSIQLGVCANESLYHLDGVAIGRRQSRKRSALSPAQSEPARTSRKSALRKSNSQDARLSFDHLEEGDNSEALPDHIFSTDNIEEEVLLDSPRKGSSMSKRQQVCMELLQTESNYVEVLKTILITFKKPLEEMDKEEMLTKSELSQIFGKIQPLYDVHVGICHQLTNLVSHWSEERAIGSVWLNAAKELQRVYPSFINSFDAIKETLKDCDQNKPKFHAFLKACQSRAECQRQSLVELLIRPVQRLGSVQLLLKDILKRTDKANGDFEQLQLAIQSIESVLRTINEAKRKTEDRVKILEICNDIENVPPELVSSQRAFIAEIDAVSLVSCGDTKKGQALTLYLFNDLLEVTKRRHRANVPRSPATFSRQGRAAAAYKSHKHIERLSLTIIYRVEDVTCSEDADGLFLLTVRNNIEEELWILQVADHLTEADKRSFLSALANEVRIICNRDVGVLEFAMSDPTGRHPERMETLRQAIKNSRALPKRSTSRVFAKPHTLRRAVSNMSLGLSKTLSRMSRSNLRMAVLDETTSSSSAADGTLLASPSTPGKHSWTWGPRKLLTQQSFVAPSPEIARRESAVSTRSEYPIGSRSQV